MAVTIPGRGDLSPRRKHRNWRRRFAFAVIVVLVAGGGYLGYDRLSGSSATSHKALPPCPAVTPTTPQAMAADLVVKNATLVTGLATDVAKQLRHRHFRIGSVGNTLFRGTGVATVQYSADRQESAQLLAAQFDGATMREVTGSQVLEVDIGPRFQALVPAAQAATAERVILGSASPSASPTASTECTPRSSTSTP